MSTLKPRSLILVGAGLLLLGSVLGYVAHTARAGGIPNAQTLTYAGTLQDADGKPLTGNHAIDFQLFDALEKGNSLCQVWNPSTGYELGADGRFEILLDSQCVIAVGSHQDLWVELRVAGKPLPRAPLGAVPYAIEANHAVRADSAASASGDLERRIVDLEQRKSEKIAGVWPGSGTPGSLCQQITNSDWTEIPDVRVEFNVDKPITIWATYSINVEPVGDTSNGQWVATHLTVDGEIARQSASHFQPWSMHDSNVNLNGNHVASLGPGPHTVTLEWATSVDAPTVTWQNCDVEWPRGALYPVRCTSRSVVPARELDPRARGVARSRQPVIARLPHDRFPGGCTRVMQSPECLLPQLREGSHAAARFDVQRPRAVERRARSAVY